MSVDFIDPKKQLKLYIRDLLGIKECHIASGRDNAYSNQEDLLVVVDDLAPAVQQSVTKTYDGSDNVEEMTIDAAMLGQFTVNFYGNKNKARESAYIFSTLRNTEGSKTLQKTYGISIFRVSSITDLRQLAGKTYHERYEITLNVGYNITNTIGTLRFDEAQFEFLYDK